MRKDVADSFAVEGKAAKERLEGLKDRSVDALALALSEAPESYKRELYRYAREHVMPLLVGIEDEGERYAAVEDVAATLGLRTTDLRKSLTEREEKRGQEEAPEKKPPEPVPEGWEALIESPGVLGRYVEDAAEVHGVVGDRSALNLLTLVALGAQLEPLPTGKPAGANLILIAQPGRGKNHLADAVASLQPNEFYLAFESASAKSLYYRAEEDPTILKHTWIYPNEAEAADQLFEMFRPLLSGGKASHLTVNKNGDGRNAAQELNVEGPVSIIIPTVRNKLDGQLQTRMLVAELEDYEGRVAAHSRALARLLLPDYADEDHTPKLRAWQAALRSLTAVRRVVFPLVHQEFRFDSDAVSHGARLWGNVLGLMCAHAWLEQRNRKIMELPGGERAVVATPEDYEAAYDVFKATCERSIVNLSDTHRKILDAVHELEEESGFSGGFSHRKIAEKAEVHHSTIGEHKTFLTKSAKLLREAEHGGLTLTAGAEPSWWRTRATSRWWVSPNPNRCDGGTRKVVRAPSRKPPAKTATPRTGIRSPIPSRKSLAGTRPATKPLAPATPTTTIGGDLERISKPGATEAV